MVNTPLLFQFLRNFQYERRTQCKVSANLIFYIICYFFQQLPINMFLLNKNSRKSFLQFFWIFTVFRFFFSTYPRKICCGDQNHQQQAIYLNVSNFLIIHEPKINYENLSLSGWYVAPILPGLTRNNDISRRNHEGSLLSHNAPTEIRVLRDPCRQHAF